ncbi:MAG: hypothetical protein P8L37_00990 [Phycisphaerales bacterium]|nr:hypothetical protein [Phycisphaerales bacterium]
MNSEHDDTTPILSDADAALLDRLVECGFDSAAVTGLDADEQARLERLVALLGLLDAYPAEPLSNEDRETLVNATLARIDLAEQDQDERMRFDSSIRGGFGSRFGAPELVAVAAIIILGLSIIFPMMHAARNSSTRSTDRNNLAQIGGGLFNFAQDQDGMLPQSTAHEWDYAFGEDTNRLGMNPLVDGGYLDQSRFNFENPGWSFQTQPESHSLALVPELMTVWISDRNPTLEYIKISEDRQAITMSISWSPSVLLSDGSVQSLPDHRFQGDDMRLPNPQCRNLEHPDVFLSHPVTP